MKILVKNVPFGTKNVQMCQKCSKQDEKYSKIDINGSKFVINKKIHDTIVWKYIKNGSKMLQVGWKYS